MCPVQTDDRSRLSEGERVSGAEEREGDFSQ